MALWHLEGSLDETGIVKKIPIDKSPFIIGRSKSLDLVVTRSGISREHAELINRDGRLFLRDLQSTNGTFVNKQRIKSEVLLTHNTIIHFAQFDFRLVDAEHKTTADEMSTVVMSMDEVRELQEKADKRILDDKPSGTSKIKVESKKQAPRAQKSSPDILSTPPSQKAVEQPKSVSTPSPPSLPNKEDGNIFVQGGGDQINRRMQPRREVRWPAVITFKNQQSLQCITKDISELGLGLKCPINIKENTLINVKINVFYKGRAREINAIGTVKHSLISTDGFIIGMHIKSCPKNSAEFISKFSSHQL